MRSSTGRRIWSVLTLLAVLCALSPGALGASEGPGDILLVCRGDAEQAELERLISACGGQARAVLADELTPALLSRAECLITTQPDALALAAGQGLPALAVGAAITPGGGVGYQTALHASVSVSGEGLAGSASFEEEITYIGSYEGEPFGILTVRGEEHPFAVTAGAVTYAPYYRAGEVSALLLGAAMRRFLGRSGEGRLYVLIDEIYPFSDLYALCCTADLLYESGIPFVARIMPVYDNLDYPSFLRYARALRYLQAKNGSVVIADSLVSEHEMVREPLAEKLSRFHTALREQEIDFLPMDRPPYPLTADDLPTLGGGQKPFPSLPIDAMVRFPLYSDEDSVRAEADRLSRLWLTVSDYGGRGTPRPPSRERPVSGGYDYRKEGPRLLANQFARSNEALTVVVTSFLLVLGGLILVGRRVYRRKFYREE